MNSADYFNKVYKEACELTAYYCKMYNLDPHGTFTYQGVKVPVITSHKESHSLKMGSNHGDPIKWLKKYGKTMDDVRNDVAKLMNAQEEKVEQPKQPEKVEAYSFTLGEEVKLVSGAKYSSGKSIASWVFKKTLYVRAINGENITISTLKTGAVTGTVNAKYLVSLNPSVAKPTPAPTPAPSGASVMRVTVNGTLVELKGKNAYIFVDVLDVYPFDMSKMGGSALVMLVDGEKAEFTTPLYDGAVISLYWQS